MSMVYTELYGGNIKHADEYSFYKSATVYLPQALNPQVGSGKKKISEEASRRSPCVPLGSRCF